MAAKMVNRKKIKVLLVDDHPIVLEGIKTHLSLQSDLEVVGSATNGHEAIQMAKALQPDVILLDISMPEMNGLEAISLLRQQVSRAKILVLTMHNTREYIAQIIQTGARGYMLKDSSPSELIRFHSLKCSHSALRLPSRVAEPFERMMKALYQKSWGMACL